MQIIEIIHGKYRFFILNAHLGNAPKIMKVQIEEIKYDCEHLKVNFDKVNIKMMGDLNGRADKVKPIRLIRVELTENTSRKSSSAEFRTMIDHWFRTQNIDLLIETEITESDQKALLVKINSLGRCKGISYFCEQSSLSKKKTFQTQPKKWTTYPDIKTYGFLGLNKVRWTIQN